jgi:hypothetical protein
VFSCTSSASDDLLNPVLPPVDNSPVLVTKYSYDNEVYTYIYNGSKIATEKDLVYGGLRTYIYNGDIITKIVETQNGVEIGNIAYTYDANNRLTKFVETEGTSIVSTRNYVYISNDHVTITETNNQPTFNSNKTTVQDAYLNTDGSLKNFTETITIKNNAGVVTQTGTGTLQTIIYDAKNNPFKNVTGYSKILIANNISIHNILDYTYNGQSVFVGSGTGSNWQIYKNTHTYNSANYPTKTITTSYNQSVIAQPNPDTATYEYNHL